MSKFEKRAEKRLEDPEVRIGYMEAEVERLRAELAEHRRWINCSQGWSGGPDGGTWHRIQTRPASEDDFRPTTEAARWQERQEVSEDDVEQTRRLRAEAKGRLTSEDEDV